MLNQYIYTKVCKECGKTFQTKSNRRIYCYDDHYRTCVVCGKSFLIKNPTENRQTCSQKCFNKTKLIPTTCVVCGKSFMRKSGELPVCGDEHIKYCECCGKPFVATKQQLMSGTKTCSNECRYKLAHDSCKKHADEDPQWYEDVMNRYKQSSIQRYGVDNPGKSLEVIKKRKQTCLIKYGKPSYAQTEEFKEKITSTNRARYGVDWYQQTDEFKEKSRQSCLERYGVDNPGKAAISIVDKMSDPSKIDELQLFRSDPRSYVSNNFDNPPTLRMISDKIGIRESSVGWILQQNSCQDIIHYNYSNMECEVVEFLRTLLDESEIIQRTRQIICPYELDIYIPLHRLGIECNPTWTHNSDVDPFPGNSPTPINYHKMKTDLCEDKGIFLFHIFGYDWSNKKEICKSMIQHYLSKDVQTVYGRNTYICDISDFDSKEFLNINHRQGYVSCSIRLGLRDKSTDELVSLMTFSKPRLSIGKYSDESLNNYELVRFCSKLNTSVVGGASKLFKYFIKEYHPDEILSFSDRSHTMGGLYELLGFDRISISNPGYVWVRLFDDIAYSRVNAQKHNIVKFLKDDTLDLSKSEREIMVEHGYVRVFDSGTITWKWRKSN